jgi:CheY-like chemotaxis protein
MSRILLADDSPHAQRMGEFILREDGFEVVSVTDGETAMVRLADVDPDLVLADVSLPRKNGYELCHFVKTHPGHTHAKVVLTAGAMEPIDAEEAKRVRADGSLRKPFEASMVIETVKRLIEEARQAREAPPPAEPAPVEEPPPPPAAEVVEPEPEVAEVEAAPGMARPPADPEAVRAAVTIALEGAMPVLIDEITQQVLSALRDEAESSG